MGQIFVAFSEYLNFTVRLDIHICTYSVCTLYANYNQDIKFPYIIKIYCFKGLDSVSTAIKQSSRSQSKVILASKATICYGPGLSSSKASQQQLVGSVRSQTIFALQHTTSSSSRVHVAALHRHGRGREHGLHGRRLAAWLLLPTVEKSASHCRLDNSEADYTTLLFYVHTESKPSSFFFAIPETFFKIGGRQASSEHAN